MEQKKLQWFTETKYTDIETGEQITKQLAKQSYTIIKQDKHTEINKTTAIKQITYLCKKTGQITLWE